MNQQPTATSHGPSEDGPAFIGGYRLLARIGEGGMGVVHLAQAPDGSRVALKVLRQHVVGDDEARERLAREVNALRRVRSPRVAEVIDADPRGDTPFVATRYVPGLSLHEHVRQEGPVLGRDLAFLATALVEALVAVHRVGVLHRDVKPSNVLMEGRAPVLIDFGLARLAEDPRLTQTGWLLGTPGYLAPEILYGEDATTASDVHSWAATVVYACTGRPPFGTGPAMAIMDRVRRGEHDLSAVPPALLPVVRRCLAPEPADRPSTHELLSVLHRTAPRTPGAPATAPIPAPATRPPADQPTVPYVLDERPADPIAAPTVSLRTPPAAVAASTARLTSPVPVPAPLPPVSPPSRAPYMTPPPPRSEDRQLSPPGPPAPPGAPGLPALQRGALLAGLFATVSLGFARAPYLSLVAISVLALVLRTASWTTESAESRQRLRGRQRWYDGPLTVLSAPWYLVVATAGTFMLLLWSTAVAFTVGFAYLLFGAPLVPGLVVMGAVLAGSLWWGPGSRRIRGPTRRLVRGAAHHPWLGWIGVIVVAAAAAGCGYLLLHGGVLWDPTPGPPWRAGTVLGDLLRWL